MKPKQAELLFPDYYEGNLSEKELSLLDAHFEECKESHLRYQRYKKLRSLEKKLANDEVAVGADLAVTIMERIEEDAVLKKRLFMRCSTMRKLFIRPAAIVSVAILAVLVMQYSVQDSTVSRLNVLKNQSTTTKPGAGSKVPDSETKKNRSEPIVPTDQKAISDSQVSGIIETVTDKISAPKKGLLYPTDPVSGKPRQYEYSKWKIIDSADSETTGVDDEVMKTSMAITRPTRILRKDYANDKDTRDQYLDQSLTLNGVTNMAMGFLDKTIGAGLDSNLQEADRNTQQRLLEQISWSTTRLSNRGYADGEEYASFIENGRTLVLDDPRSTFSIDVDTGSYTNARRFLQMGQLPPREAIRVEEFINYFDYEYPSQNELPFAVQYELAPSPFAKGRHLLKLGIKAKDALVEENSPWNLVFLIDVSGSMASKDKLPLLKRSLSLLAQEMRQNDRISIVTYANGSHLILPPTPGNKKEKILAAIRELHAGGGTNGSGGLKLAYQQAEAQKEASSVNRVILATDGDFNVGVTSFDDLMKLIEEKRKSGVTLSVLGFGSGNIREKTMEQLANRGNGNYFYIDSFQEARRVLQEKLHSTIVTVAKDVKLQLEFNPEKITEYRLIGYENRALRHQDFVRDTVDAGEVGPGHTVTALYEVVLAGSDTTQAPKNELRYQKQKNKSAEKVSAKYSQEFAFLKIRYKEPKEDHSRELSFPVLSTALRKSFADASDDFRFAAVVSAFAQLLRGNQYAEGYTYKDVLKIAQGAKGKDPQGQRREFITLLQNAASLSDEHLSNP